MTSRAKFADSTKERTLLGGNVVWSVHSSFRCLREALNHHSVALGIFEARPNASGGEDCKQKAVRQNAKRESDRGMAFHYAKYSLSCSHEASLAGSLSKNCWTMQTRKKNTRRRDLAAFESSAILTTRCQSSQVPEPLGLGEIRPRVACAVEPNCMPTAPHSQDCTTTERRYFDKEKCGVSCASLTLVDEAYIFPKTFACLPQITASIYCSHGIVCGQREPT